MAAIGLEDGQTIDNRHTGEKIALVAGNRQLPTSFLHPPCTKQT